MAEAVVKGINLTYTLDTESVRSSMQVDVANVYWDGSVPLYDLISDEEIVPDNNGVYKYWYSSRETMKVFYRETTSYSFSYYKFKTFEHCNHWGVCRSSAGTIRSTYY